MGNKVIINGQQFEASSISMPESGRLFRSAWNAPTNGVIQLDIEKVGEMCHSKREEWRKKMDTQPFPYDGDTFDKDELSINRIIGLRQMSRDAVEDGTTLEAQITALGGPTVFISSSNKEHQITDSWVKGLFQAMSAHTVTVHGQNESKKSEIDTAVSVNDLSALKTIYEDMVIYLES